MNGARAGGSVQTGGVIVIGFDEAFLVFGKWLEDGSRIRVDSELPPCRFSCEGRLEPRPFPMIRLRLDSLGFIDIHLPENTGFEYWDPDSMRLDPADRIGERHSGEPVRHGAVIRAVTETGGFFTFVEVIEKA